MPSHQPPVSALSLLVLFLIPLLTLNFAANAECYSDVPIMEPPLLSACNAILDRLRGYPDQDLERIFQSKDLPLTPGPSDILLPLDYDIRRCRIRIAITTSDLATWAEIIEGLQDVIDDCVAAGTRLGGMTGVGSRASIMVAVYDVVGARNNITELRAGC